ncbi:MAG: hypothetical protein ACRDL7_01935, partial [Gaiellaceae bacterium]
MAEELVNPPPRRDQASAEMLREDPFAIVDHLALEECFGYEGACFDTIEQVPRRFQIAWASAMGEAAKALAHAKDEYGIASLRFERRLKFFFALPTFLLRFPPGLQKMRHQQEEQLLTSRFAVVHNPATWPQLVQTYEQDLLLLRANHPRPAAKKPATGDAEEGSETTARTKKAIRAMNFMAESQYGRARKAILSHGVGCPTDPRVQAQMQEKHPLRKAPIEPMTPEQTSAFRTTLAPEVFADTIRQLDRKIAPGPGGLRYEHLQALLLPTSSTDVPEHAATALSHLLEVVNQILGIAYPAYFYVAFSSVRLVALNKKDPRDLANPAEEQDYRPVGIGYTLRRVASKALIAMHAAELASACRPTQFACGRPAGGTELVFAIQALLDARPDFVAVKVDVKNAFNEITRRVILENLWSKPSLRGMYAFVHRMLEYESEVLLGSGCNLLRAPFRSAEGVQQGDIFGSHLYCIGADVVNNRTNALLVPHGGALLAGMDDTYLVGPPAVVFQEALPAHARALSSI